MSTLREELAEAMEAAPDYASCGAGCTYQDPPELADTVLASPAMQSIRKALHKASWEIVDSYTNWATQREAMAKFLDLPESVVAWVMEGKQT